MRLLCNQVRAVDWWKAGGGEHRMAQRMGDFDRLLPVHAWRWTSELDRCPSTPPSETRQTNACAHQRDKRDFHLQAIAKDGIIPFIQPFAVSSSRGEPTRALILTICICQCGILLGNISSNLPQNAHSRLTINIFQFISHHSSPPFRKCC